VIADVDATLAAWAGQFLPDVEIASSPPVDDGKRTGRQRDTHVVLLYDVREYLYAGAPGWTSQRDESGLVVGRTLPTRAYRLTYLLIACGKDTAAEHAMLGRLLAGSNLDDVVPADLLAGELKSSETQIILRCAPAHVSIEVRRLWDTLWAAWGLRPRSMLELSVLAPMPPGVVQAVAEPPAQIALGVDRIAAAPAVPGAPHDGYDRTRRRPTARITEST
jgi:hypothetical protein